MNIHLYLATNKDGSEHAYTELPQKQNDCYVSAGKSIWFPPGTIEKIIGRSLQFEDGVFEVDD